MKGGAVDMDVRFSEINQEKLFDKLPDTMDIKQAASTLGIGKTRMYELVDMFPTFKIGKKYFVMKQHIIDYILANIKKGRR